MRQSALFTKTRKEAPKDEVAKNASLLIRAGFVHKEMAGVYSFLPLGLRTLEKIKEIIRRHMNAVGGQEVLLTALQEKSLWEKTNRWADEVVDNWFKTEIKGGGESGLGFTHEEPMTALMSEYVHSYRDLPVLAYQIQTKFRNEARAKSGIMRGREFLMKDMYSFARDVKEHEALYEKITKCYKDIFDEIGIGENTYKTFASGGVFSKFSHEFQTLSSAGEDLIFVCEKCKTAVNKEVLSEQDSCPSCGNKNLEEKKAVEVGNIFTLGTRFSEPLGLSYKNEKGETTPVFMGSYGIGPSRIMGVVAELFSDEKGIMWPQSIAPHSVHLLSFGENGKKEADALYETMLEKRIDVLYDDRDVSLGEKFADSDLIGIPKRILVSDKSLIAGGAEYKERNSSETKIISITEVIDALV